jgi:hypothetical protein
MSSLKLAPTGSLRAMSRELFVGKVPTTEGGTRSSTTVGAQAMSEARQITVAIADATVAIAALPALIIGTSRVGTAVGRGADPETKVLSLGPSPQSAAG